MTIREPRWTEQDRAEVLALNRYRDLLCPCGCGFETTEVMRREADFLVSQSTCNARLHLLEAQRAANERNSENAPARLWRIAKMKE